MSTIEYRLVFTDLILLNAICQMANDGHRVFTLEHGTTEIRFPTVTRLVHVRAQSLERQKRSPA